MDPVEEANSVKKWRKKRKRRKKSSGNNRASSTEQATSVDEATVPERGGDQSPCKRKESESPKIQRLKKDRERATAVGEGTVPERRGDQSPCKRKESESPKIQRLKKDRDQKRPRTEPTAKTDTVTRPTHPFQVDDTDHCETPLEAYRDVSELLDQIAKTLGKTRSNLKIYDPYFCDGGTQKKLGSLGFHSVTNLNRDFYDDIDKGTVPDYDVLLTNPPYSGVHMEKLLQFVAGQGKARAKPFLLLLPHFVYTKDYYKETLEQSKEWRHKSHKVFFLVPQSRYSYVPPKWVSSESGSRAIGRGKEKTAPFPSFWYIFAGPSFPSPWLTQAYGPSGAFRSKHRLRLAEQTKDIPRDFKGEFDSSKKRPNPKARKRAAKKRKGATQFTI